MEEAVHSLKAGKSPDNTPSELLKHGGKATVTVLTVTSQEDLGEIAMA